MQIRAAAAGRETRDGVPGPRHRTGDPVPRHSAGRHGRLLEARATRAASDRHGSGRRRRRDVEPRRGDFRARGTPHWLWAGYNGLPLAFAQTETLVGGAVGSPDRTRGFEVVTERPDARLRLGSESDPVAIPPGSMLIGWSGADGCLARDGVYLHVSARSEAELIAAVRALQPLREAR